MTNSLIAVEDDQLTGLQNVDLRHLVMKPEAGLISLQFTFSPNEPDTVLDFASVSNFNLSLDPGIGWDLAFVGQVNAFRFEDAGREILSRLNYRLRNGQDGRSTLPFLSGFYFDIEGEVSIEIVCATYSVRRVSFASDDVFRDGPQNK